MPVLVIFAAGSIFFWRIITPTTADRLTFQQGDFTLQFLAYRQIAYRQIRDGHFPMFTECIYSGYPFQEDPQSQVLYPPVLVTMVVGTWLNWTDYPLRALEWEVMGHVLLAALSMFVFLRSMRLRHSASVLGAIVYAFSGFMTGYAMLQTAILETAAWFPLLLFAMRRLAVSSSNAHDRHWLRYMALFAITFTFALTAGHTQSLLFMLYGGAVAFIFWARKSGLPAKVLVVRGIVLVIASLGLSAIQLVPSVSFMLASTRAQLPFNEAGSGFVLHDIAQFVLTGITGAWQPLYVGLEALFLVVIALATRRAEAWLWLSIGISALIISFGANALGFDLAYLLAPGYRQFHSQERHALIVVAALSILSAMGLQAMLYPAQRRIRRVYRAVGHRTLLWAVAAIAILVIVLIYTRFATVKAIDMGLLSDRIALAGFCLAGIGALFTWRIRLLRNQKWLWAALFVGLAVFDLFSANRYTATQPPAEPFPVNSLLAPAIAGSDLPATVLSSGAYRINNHYGLPLNAACVNNQLEIGGGSPIVLQDYKSFLSRVPEDVYSQLLNVWYTVTWRGGMGTDNGRHIPEIKQATDRYQGIEANTFELDWPSPSPQPAWIASTVTAELSDDTLYKRMNAADFQPFQEALVFQRDRLLAYQSASGTAGLEGKSTGYMKIAANTAAPAILVVSEAFHWNWVALVNAKEVKPVKVDGALLGVPVPAGASSVELVYSPTDLYVGAAVSAATLFVLAVLLAFSR
ncbi:MAG TPA: YfhO family protein [Anaerolineae bacterium]